MLCKVAQMLPASSSFASFVTGGGEHQEFAGASREAGPRLGAKLPRKDDGGGEQVSDPDVQRGQMEYLGSKKDTDFIRDMSEADGFFLKNMFVERHINHNQI